MEWVRNSSNPIMKFDFIINPRRSGEHLRTPVKPPTSDQPPRSRGTLVNCPRLPPHVRSTPARAGNTIRLISSSCTITINPRVLGEYPEISKIAARSQTFSPGPRHVAVNRSAPPGANCALMMASKSSARKARCELNVDRHDAAAGGNLIFRQREVGGDSLGRLR